MAAVSVPRDPESERLEKRKEKREEEEDMEI